MASANESGYFGTYETLHDAEGDGSRLTSGEVLLGAPLEVEVLAAQNGDPLARVMSPAGDVLGMLPSQTASHLALLKGRGWSMRACVSYLWFDAASSKYGAEVCVVAHAQRIASAMCRYEAGLFERIARGEHPTPRLTDDELSLVLASDGAWNEAEKAPYPKLKKGSGVVEYQRQRTIADTLADAARQGKLGCKVGTVLFYAALIAIIALIVRHFLF